MISSIKFGVGSAVLIAAVGFVYLVMTKDSKTPHARDVEFGVADSKEAALAVKQVNSSPQYVSRLAGKRPLEGAASYADLQAKLSRESLDPAQKADYLRMAAMFCESRAHQFGGKNHSPPTASDKVYIEYGTAFCKSFNGRSDDQAALILSHPESDVAIAQLIVVDEELSKDSRSVADRMLRSSSNPSAVLAAAGILSSAPEGEWKLGYDLAKSAVEMAHVPEARFLAARMVACDLSGGCGPGGFYSMTQCVNYQACSQNVALTDVWRDNTSKPVYRLANEMRQQLMKQRM